MFGNADVGLARDAMRRLQLRPIVRRIDQALVARPNRESFSRSQSMIAGASAGKSRPRCFLEQFGKAQN